MSPKKKTFIVIFILVLVSFVIALIYSMISKNWDFIPLFMVCCSLLGLLYMNTIGIKMNRVNESNCRREGFKPSTKGLLFSIIEMFFAVIVSIIIYIWRN